MRTKLGIYSLYIFRIHFLFILISLSSLAIASPIKKQKSSIIIDGNTTALTQEWIHAAANIKRSGYILNLKYDKSKNALYHHGINQVNFNTLFNSLRKEHTNSSRHHTFIFSLDSNAVSYFNEFIENNTEKLTTPIRGENTPLNSILSNNTFSFFSLQRDNKLSDRVHFFQDYFEQHYFNNDYKDQILHPGKAQASMLFQLFSDDTEPDSIPISDADRHIWQTKLLKHWTETGLQPILIVADDKLSNINQFVNLAKTGDFTDYCRGNVSVNGVPLQQVYWQTDPISISYGHFNFPYSDKLLLKPYKPGYIFSPLEIEISENNSQNCIVFEASPLNLEDNLELKETFNAPEILNTELTVDKARGNVLKVNRQQSIYLGQASEYNICDHSFTISFWLKTEKKLGAFHKIIGTDTRLFREGLHISFRNHRPYFGFFIDDLNTQHSIKPNEWAHLTYCFDKTVGEKRIYINGTLSDIQINSQSFIGKDSLFIGRNLQSNSNEPFYMDNLLIWSRSLNELEVKQLLHEETIVALEDINKDHLSLLIFMIVIILIAGSSAYFVLKRKKRTSQIQPSKQQLSNAIYLYGAFTIFDNEGKNITESLSPLSKELLIKLLIARIEGRQGESTQNITEHFWCDLPTSKARNSRNVALARLRKSLDNVNGLRIEFTEGKHCIKLSDEIYIDMIKSEQFVRFSNINEVNQYFDIIQRGVMGENIPYKWIEPFQDKTNNLIISNLKSFLNEDMFNQDVDSQLRFCQHILKLDDLNEAALKTLLQIYNQQGNKVMVINLFNDFKTKYANSYGEDFKHSLKEFLN